MEADLQIWGPQQRLVRATATRLQDEATGTVLLVLHDRTEEERLNRVRRDFVANVSHELRTPLTSIRGYSETLLDGGLEDAEHREEFVRVIRDAAARLESVTNDLLSLADLERPEVRLERVAFDLRESIEKQAAIFRDQVARAGISIDLKAGPPVPVSADRARLEQVIANLLDNAIKYTDRGTIDVECGADGVIVWCEVRDTGGGIADEHLPRLFERFYRVDKGRSRDRGGTGLGLSIVKHIVELHGGKIDVRSRLGEGSVFRFEIPRGDFRMNPLILIVEDETRIRDLIKYNLERAGFRTLAAADGETGLELVFASRPDAVVLDIMLPGQSGIEVLRQIRGEPTTQDLPILLLTARSTETDKLLGFEQGADDYLTKPFSPRELVARIRALLRRTHTSPSAAGTTVGDLTIDLLAHEAVYANRRLTLTRKEFDLLCFLAQTPGRVHSREELLRKVWGYDFVGETRTVDVHIRRLRTKLGAGASLIETVTGVGYKFAASQT